MTMRRKNLVLAAAIALVGSAPAGSALAQAPQNGNFDPVFSNAQQYGRGGDFGRNHDDRDWGSHRERFRAMDLDGSWVADDRDEDVRGDWNDSRDGGRGDFRDRDRNDSRDGNRGDFRDRDRNDSRGWGRDDFRGRGPMRGVQLPEFIRIDQNAWRVTIADRRDHTLQRVM